MTKLTETQTIILSAGAQRPENIALPLPKGLAGAAAKMAVTKMIEHGWLQEVDANIRRGEPLWRETGDGHGTMLVVPAAGLLAIGTEPMVANVTTALHNEAAETPIPKPQTQSATGRSGHCCRPGPVRRWTRSSLRRGGRRTRPVAPCPGRRAKS